MQPRTGHVGVDSIYKLVTERRKVPGIRVLALGSVQAAFSGPVIWLYKQSCFW